MLLIGLGTFASNYLFDQILKLKTSVAPWTLAYLVAIGLSLVGIVLTVAFVREKNFYERSLSRGWTG